MASTPLLRDTITQTYNAGSSMGTDTTGTQLVLDTRTQYSAVIPHSTTTQVMNVQFPIAKLVGLSLKSSAPVTLVNGTDTVAVPANAPVIWFTGSGTCPFTVDTGVSTGTELKITNASGSVDATVIFTFAVNSQA